MDPTWDAYERALRSDFDPDLGVVWPQKEDETADGGTDDSVRQVPAMVRSRRIPGEVGGGGDEVGEADLSEDTRRPAQMGLDSKTNNRIARNAPQYRIRLGFNPRLWERQVHLGARAERHIHVEALCKLVLLHYISRTQCVIPYGEMTFGISDAKRVGSQISELFQVMVDVGLTALWGESASASRPVPTTATWGPATLCTRAREALWTVNGLGGGCEYGMPSQRSNNYEYTGRYNRAKDKRGRRGTDSTPTGRSQDISPHLAIEHEPIKRYQGCILSFDLRVPQSHIIQGWAPPTAGRPSGILLPLPVVRRGPPNDTSPDKLRRRIHLTSRQLSQLRRPKKNQQNHTCPRLFTGTHNSTSEGVNNDDLTVNIVLPSLEHNVSDFLGTAFNMRLGQSVATTSRVRRASSLSFMATRPYVLSSPPKAAASTASKTHSRRASASGDVRMSLTPTRVPKPSNSDVEMRGSSDGWETVTQDSAWDEDGMCGIKFALTPCACMYIDRLHGLEPNPSTSSTLGLSLDIQHRLLYRGALCVPGSAILLEGIQFIARLPGVVPPLLSAPLPLALESMRRIPALKLLGTMKLSPDTARLDTEIDVRYIHPQAYVTHGYFQRVLALGAEYIPERPLLRSPHPHPHIDPRITSTAVRIGLGEDVIVVYGRLQSEEYARVERGQGTGKLELVAARLLDPTCQSDDSSDEEGQAEHDAVFAVPLSASRAPRPDDPLPREPPTRAMLRRTESTLVGGIKRTMSGTKRFGRVRSEVVVRGLGEQIDTPLSKPTKLKEPTSSVRRKGGGGGKGKSKAEEADDPFAVGGPESEVDASAVLPKMMARVKSASAAAPVAGSGGEETANKLIKRLAQSALETYGIDREDPGFKEVFGYVTRGVDREGRVEKNGRESFMSPVMGMLPCPPDDPLYLTLALATAQGQAEAICFDQPIARVLFLTFSAILRIYGGAGSLGVQIQGKVLTRGQCSELYQFQTLFHIFTERRAGGNRLLKLIHSFPAKKRTANSPCYDISNDKFAVTVSMDHTPCDTPLIQSYTAMLFQISSLESDKGNSRFTVYQNARKKSERQSSINDARCMLAVLGGVLPKRQQ
ncbi:hypothetical protein AG1IA_03931 [Rhizoctonia solani AG-1 IA]|uniref:Uncharacterized protein n=1 Tax=Thanatephorus cucumeris (strain AG1-IA) TaxID=983506 RepID=L8WZ45_THACA|nr:hypothetical protein AG1IA_03931 [Rhizoctonia solani AG-1 IA]